MICRKNVVGMDFASSRVRFLDGKRVVYRKEHYNDFGGGVGEGLAAVRGYQSGAKGRGLRCPRSPGRSKQSRIDPSASRRHPLFSE